MSAAEDIALDLHALALSGRALEAMGDAHASAAAVVERASAAPHLTRPAGIGLGRTGIADEWHTLQDQVLAMLVANGTSLRDVAGTLDDCVTEFVTADDEVRRALDAARARVADV